MRSLIDWYIRTVSSLRSLPPLFFRMILVYGFWFPMVEKWKHIDGVIEWFGSIGIPAPALNAYMAASTEALGCVLLFFGLATRLIGVPLMVIMLVAIKTVHLENGFECSKNGFEVPFYYFFMLFSLVVTGPGCLSLDALIAKRKST